MTYRFGSQFVGEGYLDNFYNRVTHPSKSEADDEEFDLVKDTEDHDSDMDDGDERDFSDSYQMPPQSNVGGSSRKVNDYDNDFARKAFARLPYFLSEYEMKRSTSHSLQDPTSYLQSVTSLNSGKREFCRIGEVHHLMQACHCQRRTLVFYPHEPMDDDSVFLEYEDCPNDGVAGIWNLDDESPLSRNANDMVFDFSRYQLAVTEEASFEKSKPESCRACRVHEHDGAEGYLWKKFVNAPDAARWGVRMKDPERKMMRFKVDVTPLQQSDRFESFNHASHQCFFSPHLKVEMMDCLTYTHLDHVHLRCSEDLNGGYLVYASYTGIVAM
ncbi:hypothetical protein BC829DRAFT_272041 [Chytridium lagenaria]|nr:hypothetical protein BC829DRAFT_272041 [Chytridium lagenaria]